MDRARWTCLLIATLGLPLYVWSFQGQLRLSALPGDLDRTALAYPVVLDGVVAATPEQLRFLAESLPPGSTARLETADGAARPVRLRRQHDTAYLLINGLSALAFWAAAAFVFAPRANRPGVSDFFWISLLYGLAVAIGGVYFAGARSPAVAVQGVLQLACLAALPVLFLHLALTFPRRRRLPDQAPWLLPALWAVAAGLTLWQAAAFVRYWRRPTPAVAAALLPPQATADAIMAALTAAALLLLAAGSRRPELTGRERKQARWLLLGFVVGAGPYVFLRSLPAAAGLDLHLPPHVDRVFELAIPASFVMVVVRHQFLDIDIILRRGLIYGLLATLLLGLGLAAGLALGPWPAGRAGAPTGALLLGLGLVAGLGFVPLKRAIGRWVDRTFFKLEHDLGLLARRLGEELAAAPSQERVAELLRDGVDDALRPRALAVLVRVGEEVRGRGRAAPAADRLEALWSRTPPPARLLAAPRATSRPELESGAFPAAYREAGFVLAVPLRGDGPLGLLLLGPRRTERRYLESELDFLEEGAGAAAAALATLELAQSLDEEVRARRRLDELNRFRSEFFARVAHDLRTPVSAIAWTVRNLLDGVSGPLGEPQVEGVRSVEMSVGYLGRLLTNLLEISRLEQGGPAAAPEAVDAAAVAAEALAIVGPVATSRQVAVAGPAPAELPPVAGWRDKLVEVLVNLLDNAIRYAPAGSEVRLGLGTADPDRIEITVADRGPGLGGRPLADLVSCYAQGEPSPHSGRRGFGLGLHIVSTYLDLMGGDLAATEPPDGGTVFVCRLPVWTPVREGGS